MQMMDALAAIITTVRHHTVTVFQSLMLCQLGDHLENMTHDLAILAGHLVAGSNVRLGNDENVYGSLGIDIPEGQNGGVFVHLVAGNFPGNDFTKQTI